MRIIKRSGILPLAVLSLTMPPRALSAQQIVRRAVCLQARPLAECRAWIPIMVDLVVSVGGTSHGLYSSYGYEPGNQINLGSFGSVAVGYMTNYDESRAVGGMIEAGSGGFAKRLALKAHGQQWLSPSWAASASVGIVGAQQSVLGGELNQTTQAHGVTADLGVDYADRLGVFVGADVTRQSRRQATALRVGMRAGSYQALFDLGLWGFLEILATSRGSQP